MQELIELDEKHIPLHVRAGNDYPRHTLSHHLSGWLRGCMKPTLNLGFDPWEGTGVGLPERDPLTPKERPDGNA